MRYPLVDGQGNFGSHRRRQPGGHALHRGAPHAARRRADARRHRQGDRRLGPELRRLASRAARSCRRKFPNLLVNGSSGIAVGMATNIPPHNLGEVIDALSDADRQPGRDDRRADAASCPGPDFPTARHSSTASTGIREAYTTGRGIIQVRATRRASRPRRRASGSRSSSPRSPTGEQGAAASRRSPSWCATRGSRASRDLRDESDRDGIRIVIELKRGESPRSSSTSSTSMTPDADDVRHHLPGDRQQPAGGDDAQRRCSATSSSTAKRSSSGARASICARPKSARTSSKASSRRSTTSTR